jgi:transcriptional regulator with XRE-family HTH domain
MNITPKDDPEKAQKADCDILPPDIQQRIYHDMFSSSSRFYFFSEIMQARPERKLAMFRELKNMSQAEVAKLAKVRQADVSKAEKCMDGVRYGVIRKIAECLGIPLSELLDGQNEIAHPTSQSPFGKEVSQHVCERDHSKWPGRDSRDSKTDSNSADVDD